MLVYIPQEIAQAGLDYLRDSGFDIKIGSGTDEETLIHEIRDADAMITRTVGISEAVMRAAPKLKVISRHGVGTDNIDLNAAKKLGITVTNGPFSNTNTVAEHIVALVLACAYRITMFDASVRSLDWDMRNRIQVTELRRKTAGLIGYGKIGKAAAEKLSVGMNMNIIAYSRHIHEENLPDFVTVAKTLEELLEKSDFVCLCCPLTEETENMINKKTLSAMKPSAYLINCARGKLICEEDLYDALKKGIIQGAALDVLAEEPANASCPLLGLPNVIFSPHCSSHSREAFDRMAVHAAMGVEEVLHGKTVTWKVESAVKEHPPHN